MNNHEIVTPENAATRPPDRSPASPQYDWPTEHTPSSVANVEPQISPQCPQQHYLATPDGLPPQEGAYPPPYPAYYEVMQPAAMTTAQQMEVIADKVGLVPNVRKKDNVLQGAVVGVCLLIGIGIGLLIEKSTMYALIGALGGLLIGTFISGFALMISGLKRKN